MWYRTIRVGELSVSFQSDCSLEDREIFTRSDLSSSFRCTSLYSDLYLALLCVDNSFGNTPEWGYNYTGKVYDEQMRLTSRGRGHDALVADSLTFVGLLKFSVRNSGVMSDS